MKKILRLQNANKKMLRGENSQDKNKYVEKLPEKTQNDKSLQNKIPNVQGKLTKNYKTSGPNPSKLEWSKNAREIDKKKLC